MNGLICIFIPCNWVFIGNIRDKNGNDKGLYQCLRCKEVSPGKSICNEERATYNPELLEEEKGV